MSFKKKSVRRCFVTVTVFSCDMLNKKHAPTRSEAAAAAAQSKLEAEQAAAEARARADDDRKKAEEAAKDTKRKFIEEADNLNAAVQARRAASDEVRSGGVEDFLVVERCLRF